VPYLLYLLSPALIVLTAAGFVAGGIGAWAGTAAFAGIALADQLMPRDQRPRALRHPQVVRILIYLHYPLLLGLWLGLALALGSGRIAGTDVLGAVLSAGLVIGGVGLPAAHELMHGKSLMSRSFADLIGTLYGVPLTDLGHVHVHHLHLGTPADGDTPRRGEGIYRFGWRSIWLQLAATLGMEAARLRRQERAIWSPRGRLLWGVLAQAAFALVFCLLAGWIGLPVLVAVWLLDYLVMADYNYVQHYGLVRVAGEPIEARHAWNHLKPLSRAVTYEITTHSEHHLDPDRPFHRLTSLAHAPQLPGVWFCFLLSFIPPLWHRVLRPRLRHWDDAYATPAERALARDASARAGWGVPAA
jgi:toluene methyl-monooxygenase